MIQHSETESEVRDVHVYDAGSTEEVRLVPPDLCDTIADYAGQMPQIQALLTYAAKGLVGQYKAQFKIHFEKVG